MKNTQMVQSMRVKGKAGFNLIEAAIVLGIVGLIVGGIWAAAGSAYENMRQQNASKQLLALVQGMRNFYSQNPSEVVDTDIGNLYGLGVLPADMVADSGGEKILRHQWGGQVTIGDGDATIASFSVNFNNMKKDACQNFLSRSVNAARGSGLLIVRVNAGVVLDLMANSAATYAGTACPEDATITYIFSLRG